MKRGLRQALAQLGRIRAASGGEFEFEVHARADALLAQVSIRIGPLERRPGGLSFRDRESFQLYIGKDFPFEKPSLWVSHSRFAGFPHVTWGTSICLYQGANDWNPSDGLYGFFERLSIWIGRASINDMDPVEGPLEPPHHIVDSSETPFMFSANAPASVGKLWLGVAELKRHANLIEVVGWHGLDSAPAGALTAAAVILPDALPMEYPQTGADFFSAFSGSGLRKEALMPVLRWAAIEGEASDPAYLIVGSPARRAPDGTARQHFSVWSAGERKYLRTSTPSSTDTPELEQLRKEFSDDLFTVFEKFPLKWCRVFENRPEIGTRRDHGRPMAALKDAKVLVLGAGALGSWAAEAIARAGPALLHIVDKGRVAPGLLVRQNYERSEIGGDKAKLLAERLGRLSTAELEGFSTDANSFLLEDLERTATYDLIVDCTASRIVQMRLEQDWPEFKGRTPRIVSFGVNATVENIIGVEVPIGNEYGPWTAYLLLKDRLCRNREIPTAFLDGFYSEKVHEQLFQPEPGCSDLTFAGSAADSAAVAGSFLNLVAIPREGAWGYAISTATVDQEPMRTILSLPRMRVETLGDTRLLIAPDVFDEARRHVKDNNSKRTKRHETGGLIWGNWDEAVGTVVALEVSGPPPDSKHAPARFICGTKGSRARHARLMKQTRGACGFLGLWHTHPGMAPSQSGEDILGMTGVVAGTGQNRRRALMLIFGRQGQRAEMGVYLYESSAADVGAELIQSSGGVVHLAEPVV